jgi:hypothetical protein
MDAEGDDVRPYEHNCADLTVPGWCLSSAGSVGAARIDE